jgi:hypothetical protein
MKAKEFLKSKGINEIKRFDESLTGEYVITPELMEEYAQLPRPTDEECNCSNSELLVEYSGGYSRCKWCGKRMRDNKIEKV